MINPDKKYNSKLIRPLNNTKNSLKICKSFQMFQHNRQYRNSTLVCSPISILCIMCRMIYNFKHQEDFISFQLNMRSQIASLKGKKCLSLLGIRRFLSILGKVLMLGCYWIIRWLKLKIEEEGVLLSVVMERALKDKE